MTCRRVFAASRRACERQNNLALITHGMREESREIRNAHIFSETDIQVLIAVVVFENENAGVGEVPDVEKFSPGRSG